MPFLKKEEHQGLPCAYMGARRGPLVLSSLCLPKSVSRFSQQGVEPGSILSGGSTHLGKQSHSSAVILLPCAWSSSEVFVKEVRRGTVVSQDLQGFILISSGRWLYRDQSRTSSLTLPFTHFFSLGLHSLL